MNRLWQARLAGWVSQLGHHQSFFASIRILSISNILIAIWLLLVYWNERTIFKSSINACEWNRWATWPSGASPHQLAFVADPQLVDPHTYPGRPWPLSSLTVMYTDIYLRRSYNLIQQKLYPDTTIFLGDLFDGGREWSTPKSSSPEEIYKKYGDKFWHREYKRFSSIFFDTWLNAGVRGRLGQPSRRQILSNLPGNHDLGFASGIQEPVRNRFNAYFGDGSGINIIGNHSFISLDTVSLSAKEDEGAPEHLWQPVQDFLNSFDSSFERTLASHLALRNGKHYSPTYSHQVIQTENLDTANLPAMKLANTPSFPMILLSHVPLYREPGTPCGPLREHWPQGHDANGKPLENDERNAIKVQRGYQYQNVLSEDISKEIAHKLENISYAFSGDDHDYCEVLHRRYPSAGGGIREITVKSVSWAMGVRKPGFQLVSLWNPVDENGVPTEDTDQSEGTLKTKMCLLPDQLSLFIRYAEFFLTTMVILVARAAYLMRNPSWSTMGVSHDTLLPLARNGTSEVEKAESSSSDDGSGSAITARSRLAVKPEVSRSRGVSPKASVGYGLPAEHHHTTSRSFGSTSHHVSFDLSQSAADKIDRKPRYKGQRLFLEEFKSSTLRVVLVVMPWYLWLIYSG